MSSSTYRSPFVVTVTLALLLGCGGDDDESEAVVRPDGPPRLEITGLHFADGSRFEPGDDGPVSVPCDTTVSVLLGPNPRPGVLENWTLRPPGACNEAVQCGYVRLRVDPSADGAAMEIHAATTSIPLDLAELVSLEGPHVFEAELRNDDGTIFTGEGDILVADQLTASFEASNCTGQGGAAGAPGTGGSGATGGSGGSFSAGGAGGVVAAGGAAGSG